VACSTGHLAPDLLIAYNDVTALAVIRRKEKTHGIEESDQETEEGQESTADYQPEARGQGHPKVLTIPRRKGVSLPTAHSLGFRLTGGCTNRQNRALLAAPPSGLYSIALWPEITASELRLAAQHFASSFADLPSRDWASSRRRGFRLDAR
jgi:hypothetical protein